MSDLIFVHPVLTPFPPGVPPNYETIETLKSELNANAQGIRSAAGGMYGHLALLTSDEEYFDITGDEDYVAPINPGDNPVHDENATQFQIAETNRAHLVTKKAYEVYCDVDLALKKQILTTCPGIYLEEMKQPHIGYGGRSALQLLTHLEDNYAKIEPSQLAENEKRMKTAWHTAEPIEKQFSQLKTTYEFAKAGKAGITEKYVTGVGYEIVAATGLFPEECKEWRKKATAEWTMANFVKFFKAANTDRMATMADGGFHNANAAASTFSEIAALKAENAKLKKSLAAKPSTNNNITPTTTKVINRTPPGTYSYCHTHGSSNNADHTSRKCTNKGPNHQDEATAENKMGGSTKVWSSADRRTNSRE